MAKQTWVAVGAAAVAIVAVTVVGVLVRGDADDPTSAGRDGDSLPSEWRVERWGDLEVQVPADWGYGGAPHRSGGTLVACWPSAMVGPDGSRLEEDNSALGYVGRPVALTDVCATYPDNRPGGPGAPYVWLGADIDSGTVQLGNDFVQETVEISGSTVTVGTDDPGLRRRILDSARGGETCLSELEAPPSLAQELGDAGPGLTVCAYLGEGAPIGLSYAATHGRSVARAFESAYRRAAPLDSDAGCEQRAELTWVVLLVEDRTYVVSTSRYGCLSVEGPEGPVRLTEDLARSWAVDGVPGVVYAAAGAGDQWVYDYFIGPQG